jgi:antitoxin (DNA-binding transcriptional repressor) of toxin-antitoxin stability system
MSTFNLQDLARDPNALIDRVQTGECLVVIRDGHPVAELRPLSATRSTPRPYALAAGTFAVPDDFDAHSLTKSSGSSKNDETAARYSCIPLVHHG